MSKRSEETRVIGRIALIPSRICDQNSLNLHPAGETTPSPVTTTLFISHCTERATDLEVREDALDRVYHIMNGFELVLVVAVGVCTADSLAR